MPDDPSIDAPTDSPADLPDGGATGTSAESHPLGKPSGEPSGEPLNETLGEGLDFADPTFEAALETAQTALNELRDRYWQVCRDRQRQVLLQREKASLEAQLQRHPDPASLQAQLQILTDTLSELEVNLESRLFSWDGFREVFWQAVRFGGLGVVLGWLLKAWAG